jgi:hypothetical protein
MQVAQVIGAEGHERNRNFLAALGALLGRDRDLLERVG